MTYYFLFTSSGYDEYSVDELCICDHIVTLEEWNEHCKVFEEAYRQKQNELKLKFCERTATPYSWRTDFSYAKKEHLVIDDTGIVGYAVSGEMRELQQWHRDNDPRKTFKKLHNMESVGFQEFNFLRKI